MNHRVAIAVAMFAGSLITAAQAPAQQGTANGDGGDILRQLRNTRPEDLGAAGRNAVDEYNRMTPEQRAAAAAAANAQVPALIGPALQWWQSLTPEQQRAYLQQVQGLSGQLGKKP